jgi:Transposase IS4
MDENFSCSWICCVDELMSAWINRYACPGYMYVPRKPWPQGNEYHTACCGTTGILFRAELAEGKDHPPHVPVDFLELGKLLNCSFE